MPSTKKGTVNQCQRGKLAIFPWLESIYILGETNDFFPLTLVLVGICNRDN